jgi:shikimate kinase
VFLIGYRGTGKTTAARMLAAEWNCESADLDEMVEATSGRTICELFNSEGEAGFRRREANALAEVCARRRLVVATGGGIVLEPANCERMRCVGQSVWLTAEPETIWTRLQSDPLTPSRRPDLLMGGLEEIRQMTRLREPFYRAAAQHMVSTEHRSPDQVVRDIAACMLFSRGEPAGP